MILIYLSFHYILSIFPFHSIPFYSMPGAARYHAIPFHSSFSSIVYLSIYLVQSDLYNLS